ncbi:MAG TPA: DNA polymerase III subunit alpha [Actinomycetota bacterium]|nr:DNA polymerase III subunit alpha [Actinomycetota bacterium]
MTSIPRRCDGGGFVHLHCHSTFSLRDGAIRPEELAVAAAAAGMRAVALTDHESLSGVVRFVQACRRTGVVPIVGTEVAVGESNHPSEGHRVLLLGPGRRGYAALCGLLTEAHMRSESRAVELERSEERDPGWPRVSWSALERYADFLVCLSGGPKGEIGRACAAGRADRAKAAARRYLELFGTERFRIELQRHLVPGEDASIFRARALASRLGVRTVATNDVHYLQPSDALLHDVLRSIRRLAPVELQPDAERYFKTSLEMRALFSEAPEAVAEAERLSEDLAADIGLGESCLPAFPGLAPGESGSQRLQADALRGLESRGLTSGAALRRLDSELEVIARRGFDEYFLVVADIVREVRSRGIRVSCRGSAVGSLVCYALRISEVDPVHHGLLFERFLSDYRDELPDIDLDVESHRREEVLDYLLRFYGRGRMGMACMFETFQARHAIRDVGKSLGLPPEDIDQIAKAFPHVSAKSIPAVRDSLPELKGVHLRGAEVEQLLSIAARLDGFPRHLALHPCGVLLASVDLDTRTPLQPSFARFPMSQHDKDDVDALGLLKLDVIGVRMLSSMGHAVREIKRIRGADVDLDEIRRDDPDTFEMIQTSSTLGCFQIESPGQRELVTKLLPDAFEDLIVDISLFRPGPVKADMVGPYLKRRMALQEPTYVHPVLRPILCETHGVVVFHEQVMRVLSAFTGMSLGEADGFRRAMGGDEADLARLRLRFVDASLRNGFGPREAAERYWKEIESFASFGFCKAHAAAFAVPTYQSAWLKAHYPAEFLAGVLTHDPGMYPRRAILAEARRLGIPVLPLDVEVSDGVYRAERFVGGVVASGCGAAVGAPGSSVAAGFAGRSLATPSLPDTPTAAPLRFKAKPPTHVPDAPAPGTPTTAPSRSANLPAPSLDSHGGALRSRDQVALGIRLSLADVKGISEDEVRRIVEERPFESVEDFVRRARVRRPVAEGICECGGLDRFGPRRLVLLEIARVYGGGLLAGVKGAQQEMRELGLKNRSRKKNGQASLFDGQPARLRQLASWGVGEGVGAWSARDMTSGERVRAELDVLGLDASRHVVSFYEAVLDRIGWTPASQLQRHRTGDRVTIAGVKVATQTPPLRSGKRVIFLTLDDPTGLSDAVVFEDAQDRCARTVFDSWLLVVRGTLRRTGRTGASVIIEEAWDLPTLAREKAVLPPASPAPAGHGRGRGRLFHASGGSAG